MVFREQHDLAEMAGDVERAAVQRLNSPSRFRVGCSPSDSRKSEKRERRFLPMCFTSTAMLFSPAPSAAKKARSSTCAMAPSAVLLSFVKALVASAMIAAGIPEGDMARTIRG